MDSTLLPSNVSSNITFNEDILTETLQEIQKSSFQYVKQYQREMVGYLRFDFTFDEFNHEMDKTKTNFDRYVLNIPKQFIPTEKKKRYLNSGLFRKEASISDIASNYDVFTYNFLVFIKGKIYTNLFVLPDDDFTKLVLYMNDSIIQSDFDIFMSNKEKVTVMFIPNSAYGYIDTNTYALKKWDNKIDMGRINFVGVPTERQQHFVVCEDDVTKSGYFYSDAIIEDDSKKLIIPENIKNDLKSTVLKVHVITFNDYDTITTVRNEEYFQLPLKEHFIPVENILPFRIIDGKMHFVHSHKLTHSYPDIYHLSSVEPNIDYSLISIYHVPSNDVAFANEIQLFYRFFKDQLVEMHKNGTLNPLVKDYVGKLFKFSISDLDKSAYKDVPLDYKVDKMNNFILSESRKLTNYVYNMTKKKSRLFVKTDTESLASKLRKDTSKEQINQPNETFSEDRYVFIFYKYLLDGYSLSFFIDGSFYVPDKIFSNKKYFYYYIPTSIIKAGSVIEIEKFKNFYFEKDVKFDNSLSMSFNLPVDFISPRDIYIINKTTGDYYPEESFSYITEYGDEIDHSSHKELGRNFKIKLLDNTLLPNVFNFNFKQIHQIFKLEITTQAYVSKGIGYRQDISRDPGKMRVFKNGRLVPRDKYFTLFKDNTRDVVLLNLSMTKEIGDVFHFEITPDSYSTNTYIKEIETSGKLNLGGYINKPFDLRWFDVFLNGYKLQPTNFDILTPTKVLINNVKTKDNLEIVERNWTGDIFRFNTSNEFPIPNDFKYPTCTDDELLDKIPELQDKIDEITKEIEIDDSIKNVVTDDVDVDLSVKVVQDIFRYLINTDEVLFPNISYNRTDLPPRMVQYITDNKNLVVINPNRANTGAYRTFINPNQPKLDESLFVEADYVIF